MNPGQLRHRVAIERNISTRSGTTGELTESWEPVDEVWAQISPLSARDFIAAQAVQSQMTARILLRWRNDLTATMRIRDVESGVIYSIQGEPLPDNRSGREWLTLLVSTGVNDGR